MITEISDVLLLIMGEEERVCSRGKALANTLRWSACRRVSFSQFRLINDATPSAGLRNSIMP